MQDCDVIIFHSFSAKLMRFFGNMVNEKKGKTIFSEFNYILQIKCLSRCNSLLTNR